MDLITFGTEAQRRPATLHLGDCLKVLESQRNAGIQYDAVITDPPYEIGLHRKIWDRTGISFSSELWCLLHAILKPGGYIAAFGASRLYHRLGVAAEDAGFLLYPFLVWEFPGGLPKPVNLSELFDRANVPNRQVIG